MQQNPNSNYSNYPSNPSQFNSQPSSSLQPGTGQGFSISPSGFALGQYIKNQGQSQPDPNLSQPNPSSYPPQTQNSNASYQQPSSLPQQNLPVSQSNQQPSNYMEQSFSPQKQVYQQQVSNNPQQNPNNYSNNPPPMNNTPSQNANNYQQNASSYPNNPPVNAQSLNNPAQNPNNYSQNLSNTQALYPPSNQNPQQGNYYPPQNNINASQNIAPSQNSSFLSPEPTLPQQQSKLEPAKPKPMEQEQKPGGVGLEEIPDFIPFVEPNSLKSQIPYPKDLVKIEAAGQIAQSKYSFTPNTNAFYVIEEERNTAVLKSEAMKPHMIYKESLINEWVDEELPHDITCVTRDPSRQEIFRAVSWKKLSEVAPEDGFAIIYDTNRPQELITGLLNDRALQSALAVLAENEDFFPYIFPEFNESSHTISCLWLNHTGEWKIYVLDEYYPFVVNAKSSPPAFTSTKNETWVLIIEKAFAKMYGGYLALEKGHPAHYVHDLTGAPYRYFYYENPVDCWQYLMANYKTATVVAMNKDPRFRIDDENDLSKEPSFCYAVINIQEINFGKNVERIVKLRNPWREIAWNGDWSPQSNRWNQELMQKLNPEGPTNDYFWIGINDFVKYFGMGFSFSINQKYQHSSLKFRQSYQRNSTIILMNVDAAGTTSIQISQMDARHFPQQGNNRYTYSLVKMMIMEVDEKLQGKRFITGIYDKGRDCEIETFLEAGDYMIYVEIDWEQTIARDATISAYGPNRCVFYEINSLESQDEVAKKFFQAYFMTNPPQEIMLDYGFFGDSRIKRYVDFVYGYLGIFYINNSEAFTLYERVRMEALGGLEIMLPFNNSMEFDVIVQPKTNLMVTYKTTMQGQLDYYYKPMSYSYLYPTLSDQATKNMIMANPKKVIRRKLDGKDTDIYLYIYECSGGYCFYYNNRSKYIYQEKLRLDLVNLVDFDHTNQTIFDINLDPQKDFLLKFRVKDILQPFSFTTHVTYKIFLLNFSNNNTATPLSGGSGGPSEPQPRFSQAIKEVFASQKLTNTLAPQPQTNTTSSNRMSSFQGESEETQAAYGQQRPPKVVTDMFAMQKQQYGGAGETRNINNMPVNQVREESPSPIKNPPKVVTDMFAMQKQQYGGGPMPQNITPQNNNYNPGPPNTGLQNSAYNPQGVQKPVQNMGQGQQQGMPKVVNDMMNHQMGGGMMAVPNNLRRQPQDPSGGQNWQQQSPTRGSDIMRDMVQGMRKQEAPGPVNNMQGNMNSNMQGNMNNNNSQRNNLQGNNPNNNGQGMSRGADMLLRQIKMYGNEGNPGGQNMPVQNQGGQMNNMNQQQQQQKVIQPYNTGQQQQQGMRGGPGNTGAGFMKPKGNDLLTRQIQMYGQNASGFSGQAPNRQNY